MKTLLPIGSVVLLDGGEKRLMVYGRVQREAETKELFDYVGCYYPEGVISTSSVILFNHEDIQNVFFIGFQDEDEFAYQSVIADFFAKQEQK